MAKKPKLTPEQEANICTDYKAGVPMSAIVKYYGISSKWVYALLRYHKVPTSRMHLPGPRSESLGVDVTPKVKKYLGEDAKLHETSKSALGSQFISDGLRKRGYDVDDEGRRDGD